MSTRSNITIKVKPEDFQMVNEKLGYNMTNEKQYLQIYSHSDGYPEHMMNELPKYFNKYEDVLNLIMEGDTSGVYDGVTLAYAKRGESYEDNKPRIVKEPMFDEEYLYVFENDEWHCTDLYAEDE